MEEEQKEKKTSNNNWKIAISLTVFAIIVTILLICVIKNFTEVAQTNAGQKLQEDQNNEENIEELVNLEDLTSVSNKTEEELKKLNEEEIKKEEKNQTNTTTPKNKYYIKVNYKAQVVNVYTYDKNGKYTVPVKAFVCSTGTETPTSGVYKIPAKIVWCHMFGDVYAHYCTQIVGNILFHSVPYLEKSNDTLEYWAYDKLGTKASMGCIRLTTRDAKWIFDNVSCGTQVEFYASSNPGPLGKPTAQKISNAPGELKNWDPTDPDSRNPWHTYKAEENETQNNEIENNEQQDNTVNNEVTNNEQGNNITNNEESNNEQGNNTTNNEESNNEQGNNTTNNEESSNKQENNQTENNQQQNNEAVNNEQKPQNNEQENNEVSSNQV